ncbi:MAG: polysulfide reductase NrfD [Bacteroidales bacterium]|nr:polysulfide reductase NrfD [Bacteroidales bacterium]
MAQTLPKEEAKARFSKIVSDLTKPLSQFGQSFQVWGFVLFTIITLFGYAYFLQLRDGLGVTGMHDYAAWGMYIANFVFFVAAALVGMLITAVLGLIGIKWITPVSRIAEMVAVAFAMMAGLVIVFDMGRPDRLLNVFLYGRLQSPIVWDLTVVMTYTVISLLLLILPMIPDIAIIKKNLPNAPKWQRITWNLLSFGWTGTPEQYKSIHRLVRVLAVLIVPVALAIHTVTSWLFASTLRHGWDSTIFGPYFVTGAFVSGVAAVIIAMYIFRVNYKLENYITDFHFDKIAKLLVLTSLVYFYFNINEFLVPAYKMKQGDDHHILSLFVGEWAGWFWFAQVFGNILPIILLLFKKMRKPTPMFYLAILTVLGAWAKRYIIVVPTQLHPHLPVQNVPEAFHVYYPTGPEIAITIGTIGMAITIITILAKLFPVVSIWETAKEDGVDMDTINE